MYLIRCVSILILFQMKSMKVICKKKNNMNKEFEHDEELWVTWEKHIKKTCDSMRVNSQSVSNEIDEINMLYEKHSEQRIWTWWGIVINLREEQT
jgi:hypothetical protein